MNTNKLEKEKLCFKLAELIQNNPGIEIITCVDEDDIDEDSGTGIKVFSNCRIDDLTIINNRYMDRDEVDDYLRKIYEDKEEYSNLSDEEFNKACQNEVNKYKFKKYIVLY